MSGGHRETAQWRGASLVFGRAIGCPSGVQKDLRSQPVCEERLCSEGAQERGARGALEGSVYLEVASDEDIVR